MIRVIPEGAVEAQTGLYLYLYTRTIGGREYTFGEVYSSEGYCFYEVGQPENYDEEGNLLPPEQRVYAQYSTTLCRTIEEVNACYVSVPVQDGYEIVSAGNNHETV